MPVTDIVGSKMTVEKIIKARTILEEELKAGLMKAMTEFIEKTGIKDSDTIKLDAGYDSEFTVEATPGAWANITINL